MLIRFFRVNRASGVSSRGLPFRFDNGSGFHNDFSMLSQQGLSRRAESTAMTETPDLPSTPEQPRPANQEADRELVPAAVLPQQGETASAPQATTPLPVEPAQATPSGPSAQDSSGAPGGAWPNGAGAQANAGSGAGGAGAGDGTGAGQRAGQQGWLQEPPASLAPPSVPGTPSPTAPGPVQQPAAAPAPQQPSGASTQQPAPAPATQQGEAAAAQQSHSQGGASQESHLQNGATQQGYAAPTAQPNQAPGQAPGYAAPSQGPTPTAVYGPHEHAAPSWAIPESGGLPPYGEGPAPIGFEPAPAKPQRNRTLLAAALIAALVGGGVGAAISYAVRGNSGNDVTSATSVNTSGLNTGSANATAVTAVAQKVLPSVVTITVAPASSGSGNGSSSSSGGDIGTGIILSSTGEILTNNHVISTAAGGGYTITVTFDGGANAQATIVDRDPTSDLAVIQATNVSGLTPATLGDSTGVQVGQQVVAIGAPLGMSNTVTSGIVSALNRPVIPATDSSGSGSSTQTTSTTALDAIQTDAAINPGNSGGPLIDMNGHVIGINAAIASTGSNSLTSSESGSIGLGFAIPISQAEPVIKELQAKQTPTHSVLGVQVEDAATTASHTGATLAAVNSGGAAAQAGLKTGDEIIKLDDQEIDSSDALEAAVHSYRPGTSVKITYLRNGQQATTTATLASATDSSS
jgi:putative serine protease PepD